MLTSMAGPSVAEEADVDAYLTKPVRRAALLETVAGVFTRRDEVPADVPAGMSTVTQNFSGSSFASAGIDAGVTTAFVERISAM